MPQSEATPGGAAAGAGVAVQDRPPLTAAAAREHVAAAALRDDPIGPVGLELEFHLVDLTDPAHPVAWARLREALAGLGALPGGSAVTVEPGGQVELSTPPAVGLVAAVAALRADRQELARQLRARGLGLAPLGADPARPVRRINPAARYAAMERHFDALGCGEPGRAMMAATAALQINLNAGPEAGWGERVERMHRLGPVLTALAACSPWLAGRSSGWQSMRQQAWGGIDPARCGPWRPGADPARAWASYALAAPVMLVCDPGTGSAEPLTVATPFAAWIAGRAGPDRAPRLADLDYHLTTLFPPIRPRGYLEIRCVDSLPDRFWPGLAAIAVTLLDDDVAAGLAAEACGPLPTGWELAARAGLRDRQVQHAALRCVEIAASTCPAALAEEVAAWLPWVERGRSPGDAVDERVRAAGALTALREYADA